MTLYEYMAKKQEDLKNKIDYYENTIETARSMDTSGMEANLETLQTIYDSNDLLQEYVIACAIDEANKFTDCVITAQQCSHDSVYEFSKAMNNMGYLGEKIDSMGFDIQTLMKISKEELFERSKALYGLGSSIYQDIKFTGDITRESYFLFNIQCELKDRKRQEQIASAGRSL